MRLVVARPLDGAPVVLGPAAAIVWQALDEWRTPAELETQLAVAFPDVSAADRAGSVAETLRALTEDDLIERS